MTMMMCLIIKGEKMNTIDLNELSYRGLRELIREAEETIEEKSREKDWKKLVESIKEFSNKYNPILINMELIIDETIDSTKVCRLNAMEMNDRPQYFIIVAILKNIRRGKKQMNEFDLNEFTQTQLRKMITKAKTIIKQDPEEKDWSALVADIKKFCKKHGPILINEKLVLTEKVNATRICEFFVECVEDYGAFYD